MRAMNHLSGVIAAGLLAAAAGAPPASAAFVLSNDEGGDGYVVAGPAGYDFTLFGSDNESGENWTLYSAVADDFLTISGRFRYVTADSEAGYDPAGWFVAGDFDDFVELSDDDLPSGEIMTGDFSFEVDPGLTYGFYVLSEDGCCGRGQISIDLDALAVPEPASWAVMILGFAGAGAALRRRRWAPAS